MKLMDFFKRKQKRKEIDITEIKSLIEVTKTLHQIVSEQKQHVRKKIIELNMPDCKKCFDSYALGWSCGRQQLCELIIKQLEDLIK